MDTKKRAFLDLLPAPFATLDNWRTAPPFPLLGSGRYHTSLESGKYEDLIALIVNNMQEFDQFDLDELFFLATKCFSVYCQLSDDGAPASDVIRQDFARLAYQLCLNFRDAVPHLDLHDDDAMDYGFHFGVDIEFYTDTE